jgi:DNA-binding LacI/PurR family transcriptional regulator
VCLDRLPIGLQIDSVCVNDCAGAEMGVSHLISQGHKRIAILTGPLSLANEQERLRGYKRALEQARIELDESLIWEGSLRQEEIIAICEKRLLRMKKRPSALFCTNGVTGMGALRGLAACGITTPDDIAFVTFDELTTDDFFRPAITSVVQPAYDIGYRATEVLLNRLAAAPSSMERTELRLPATLKIRESSDFPCPLKEK